MRKIHVAIFASGNGTNAEEFFRHFQHHKQIKICALHSNNADAFALTRASNYGIPTHVFNRKEFYQSYQVLKSLQSSSVDFIVLAGFMWLIPVNFINSYPGRIINIHPALLPKYGGKGMYGDYVHQAVINAKETDSGITIHYVNDRFDEGEIIFQKSIKINTDEDAGSLANKVHQLEYTHYPEIAEQVILSKGILAEK